MSTDWIKYKRLNWPEGSLERQLKLRGAKTLGDAVKNQVKDNRELTELKKQLEGSEGDKNETKND